MDGETVCSKKGAVEEQALDYSGSIAIILGVVGLMFRHKLSSWLALIFCAQSLANMKNYETDLKHITMALMFAVMGLASNYFGATTIRPSAQYS